jgi:hypothetical protein
MVLDLELDVDALTGLHTRVGQAAADPNLLAAPSGEQRGRERQ